MRYDTYKRKDGRWESYVIYTDPDTGKNKKKSFYCRTAYGQKSRQAMTEFIRKIESGDYSDIRKITVEKWLDKFMFVYCHKLAQTTKEGYSNYIEKHIKPVLGKLKVNDVKPLHIEQFYNKEREKGFKEKTILQEHRILHRAFKKAVSDGLTAKNPVDGVDAPSPEDYKPTIYSEEQFNLLLKKLKGHRMEIIILLAGMCGLRRAELLGLTWENIDLQNKVIKVENTIVPTKGGNLEKGTKNKSSTREISIPSAIIPSLKRLRGIGKVYTKLNGEDYNPGSVSRIFKEFLKDNDLPHIRLHDLRHFNATMMLKYKVSEKEAQERLGHSNPGMTNKYQHVLKEMDQKSANKLNKILKNC
ncbi:MAG: tyrosine-type recombinase/integrase [Peptococcales bacterium]|jgi:integrase